MWGWATCRRVKGSAEWSPVLHPGQRAHGVGAEHGSAHIPCCHCGLHFPGLGPGDTAPEVFAGCCDTSRVVTLLLQGRKASPRLPHFHGNLGVPMPQLPVGDCSGRSATWKWPLALCWRLPKGIAGGRRIWAGPDLGLPLLSVTLLRGSQVILSLDLETTARE